MPLICGGDVEGNVKRILRLICLALFGLLAACAAAPALPTDQPADPESAAPGTQPTEDFTLIGKTGRPQFLDSFATW